VSLIEILDPTFVRDILATQRDAVGTPDSSPPPKGIVLLGYDGTYLRRVKVTSDGKLLAVLG
jgi:hypothetical protein